MSTQIFNSTIGQIVDVPDEAVDAYLAQDAYRRVKKSDYGPQSAAPDSPPDQETAPPAEAPAAAPVPEPVPDPPEGAPV